jgi:hypothetical protein
VAEDGAAEVLAVVVAEAEVSAASAADLPVAAEPAEAGKERILGLTILKLTNNCSVNSWRSYARRREKTSPA